MLYIIIVILYIICVQCYFVVNNLYSNTLFTWKTALNCYNLFASNVVNSINIVTDNVNKYFKNLFNIITYIEMNSTSFEKGTC